MAKVECAVCGKRMDPYGKKRCNNCDIWLCGNCVSGGLFTAPKCPKCGKTVK